MTKFALTEKYILLMTRFAEGEISAPQFESSYLEMFKGEACELPDGIYSVLNNLFLDVDAYCAEADLRDEEELDDDQLLASAKNTLEQLTS